jgi:dolichol-phosphate mannosyltransferase
MRLDIVIPSYNEEENVEKLAKRILDAMESYDFELTFVNDGSKDATKELVDNLAKEYESITAIHHPENKGYAEALRTGFNHGISGGFDAVLIMDSDQTHDPIDIPKFIDAFKEGADLVVGSRYVPGGGMTNVPVQRVFISKAANLLFRWFKGKGCLQRFSGIQKGGLGKDTHSIRFISDSR